MRTSSRKTVMKCRSYRKRGECKLRFYRLLPRRRRGIAFLERVQLQRQRLAFRRSDGGRWRRLWSEKFFGVQQRPPQGRAVASPWVFLVDLPLEQGAHTLHLRVEVVHVVQQQRFRKHGELRRTEFVFAVMADDQVLKQCFELWREIR